MTITVHHTYVVEADQTLDFSNESAFLLDARYESRPAQLTNYGVVQVAADADEQAFVAVDAGANSVGAKVLNKAGARLEMTATGTNADLTAIRFAAADGLVKNKGEIFAQGTKGPGGLVYGVYADADGLQVRNDGSIHGEGGGSGIGVHSGGGASVINTGDITGLVNRAYGAGYGVEFEHGGSLMNSGNIEGLGRGYSIGVVFNDGVDHFENTGTILGSTSMDEEDAIGVLINTSVTHQTITIDNSGLIKSHNMDRSDYAIWEDTGTSGQAADITVNNSGKLIGSVILSSGKDVVANSGEIDGIIRLGGGGDLLMTSGAGINGGVVDGGDGSDTLIGGRGADTFYGDNSTHAPGADLLEGREGSDFLAGNDGEDTLIGGHGADTLYGGLNIDRFEFDSINDSKVSSSDLIADLEAQDRIDLSEIDADKHTAGDQAFTLVGHLDSHAGQAALSYDAGTNETSLQLDVNGDGVADALVRLSGDQTGFSNFVL